MGRELDGMSRPADPQPDTPYGPPASPRCTKCQGDMAEGWIPETDNGIIRRVSWAAGAPTPRRVFGGFNSPPEGQSLPVTAYHCVRCGFLEFYARP